MALPYHLTKFDTQCLRYHDRHKNTKVIIVAPTLGPVSVTWKKYLSFSRVLSRNMDRWTNKITNRWIDKQQLSHRPFPDFTVWDEIRKYNLCDLLCKFTD